MQNYLGGGGGGGEEGGLTRNIVVYVKTDKYHQLLPSSSNFKFQNFKFQNFKFWETDFKQQQLMLTRAFLNDFNYIARCSFIEETRDNEQVSFNRSFT